jgi:hypothetical protein
MGRPRRFKVAASTVWQILEVAGFACRASARRGVYYLLGLPMRGLLKQPIPLVVAQELRRERTF